MTLAAPPVPSFGPGPSPSPEASKFPSSFPPPAHPDEAHPDEATVSAFEVGASFRPNSMLRPAERTALCASLRALAKDQGWVAAIVAAGDAGRNSARVAAEMALCLSNAEAASLRVLLVEAAFEQPALSGLLGLMIPPGSDFARQLEKNGRSAGARQWNVLKCASHFHALVTVGGKPDLLLTRTFETCIAELRVFYDMILIHGASVEDAVRARALDDVADSVVVVSSPPGPSGPSPFKKQTMSVVVA
jgi:hypothetical protein